MNKIIIKGNITKDIELKQTTSGKFVTQFTVATSRRFEKEKSDYHTVVTWEKTAEFVSKYFHKGSPIIVVGELQYRDWEDKNGNKRISAEIKAEEVDFAGSSEPSAPVVNAEPKPNFTPLSPDEDLPF